MDPDRQLIDDFEACRLDAKGFHHAQHLRLVWSYLRAYPYAEAERRLREGLQRLTAHVGARTKYHETITIAWTRLVAWAVAMSPRAASFEDLARHHGWLLEKNAILQFYSRERLMSDAARARWVEPDLKTLPGRSEAPVRSSAFDPGKEMSPCESSSSEPRAPLAARS